MVPSVTRRSVFAALAALAAIVAILAAFVAFRRDEVARAPLPEPDAEPALVAPSATYVGSAACAGCHAAESAAWRGSHHHRAMERADEASVLGDFGGSVVRTTHHEARFARRGRAYVVTTENAEGEPETFEIRYTLGVYPLQQYLVEFDDGRLQALPFAWDARPRDEGGQRWYPLYPDEDPGPDDPLFWTRPLQNWNHMCGDCHTTDFRKGYDGATDHFDSRYSELGNGCESCHGPGSEHARRNGALAPAQQPDRSMQPLRTQRDQIDRCGSCHARRVRLREDHAHESMHGTWRPELLEDETYFVDGQIRDEVFEIGSFLQSKMAARGVTCTDCHDPHTARPRAEGNALCVRCHSAERFDSPQHHFHEASSPGARCVDCHMPQRTYMGVHARRDHRIAVPRPDLGDALGTPNACATCHEDRGNTWAAEAIRRHLAARGDATNPDPTHWSRRPALGPTRAAIRANPAEAAALVRALLATPDAGPIAHATAIAELGRHPSPEALGVVDEALHSPDPWWGLGGVHALATAPVEVRAARLLPLASDPSLGVRLDVAPLLAEIRITSAPEASRHALGRLFTEYRAWLGENGDRAGAMVSLANLERGAGDLDAARRALETALRRDDAMLTATLNLADLLRGGGDESGAQTLLLGAAERHPESADVHFALGLLQVRTRALPEAIRSLERATQLAPHNGHYAYVHAVALHTAGETGRAIERLLAARARFPELMEIRDALRTYCDDVPPERRDARCMGAADEGP